MAVQKANYVWRDYETDGVVASGFHKPIPRDLRTWGTNVEQMMLGAAAGATIYDSKADMDADTSQAANAMAWVLGDATAANNGVYQFDGTDTWTRLGDLPYSYITAANAGAGTANAIVATTSIPIPAADGAALIALPIAADTTASPATIVFNGGSALTIKTNSGNDIAAGGLTSGMIVAGYVSGSTFRLLSDQASAAIQAAAESAQAAAEAAQEAAETAETNAAASAASIDYLVVADRTALKAVDTTKHTVTFLKETGREGNFQWDSSDLSTEVTADTLEGIYVAPSSDTTGASGAWVRQGGWHATGVRPEWFGAKGDGTTDDATAIESAAAALGTSGGIIRLDPTKDYYVSDLTLPSMCVIDGGHANLDTYADGVTYTGQGTFRFHKGIILASTGTITLQASAGIQNIFAKRDGWAYTDTTAVDYAGTFVTVAGYGASLCKILAIGFNTLVSCPDPGQSRLYIDKFYGDALNGLDLDRSADVSRIYDVHLWPFGTIEGYTADGATDNSMLVRSGTALKMRDGAAGTQIDNFFALGYMTGVDLGTLSTLNIGQFRVEIPSDQATGSIGVKIGASVTQVYLDAVYTSGYEKCVQANQGSNDQINIGYLEAHLGSGTVVECQSGFTVIDEYYGEARSGILFDVQATGVGLKVKGRHRTSSGTLTDYLKVATNVSTNLVDVDIYTDADAGDSIVSGTFILPGSTDSGGVIDLSPNVNLFVAPSSNDLTTINGGWTGRRITIQFAQRRTIQNTGNIAVAIPFAAPANQIVSFVFDGTNWVPEGFQGAVASYSIANDAAISFTPHQASGFVEVFVENNTTAYGLVLFRAGTSPATALIWNGTALERTTGELTGTTGTDTKLTVSAHTDGKIYIENQLGAAASVVVTQKVRP